MNFYISDTHFSHENIIKFDNRPFINVQDMNNNLIYNWNKVVTKQDTVYILGDFCWNTTEAIDILSQLNGSKVLLKGNHDSCTNEKYVKLFKEITDYLEIIDGDYLVVLSHYPIFFFNKRHYGAVHLYGHVHNSLEEQITLETKKNIEKTTNTPCMMFNVGCMKKYMEYQPKTLEYIMKAGNLNE